jgi:phosphatidylserine/phosphatidylglycerophosphate/cardiolipin synthase-like enzyme
MCLPYPWKITSFWLLCTKPGAGRRWGKTCRGLSGICETGLGVCVREIDNATLEILVQAYSFTSAPIAKALVNAHKRGVSVEVILDKSQRMEKYSSATFLGNSGIPTYIDAAYAIAHNKIMIIDKQTVITGSFNFTRAAEEKNAENLLIIKSKELESYYLDNWQKHRQHSEVYRGRY